MATMTGIFAYILPKVAIVAMDTLTSHPETNEPSGMTMKMYPLCQMRSVLCGVGGQFTMFRWYEFLNECVLAKDIDGVKIGARKYIDDFVREFKRDHRGKCPYDSALYHIGYSEKDGRMRMFTITFKNGKHTFEDTDALYFANPPSIFLKNNPLKDLLKKREREVDLDLPAVARDVLKLMKEYEDARPQKERIVIGGEIHTLVLIDDGTVEIQCDKFSDYDETFQKCSQSVIFPPE